MNRFKHLIADTTSETLNEWTLNQSSNLQTTVQEIVDASVGHLEALIQENTDQISKNDEKVAEELKQVWFSRHTTTDSFNSVSCSQIKSSLQQWSEKLKEEYQKLLEESALEQSQGVCLTVEIMHYGYVSHRLVTYHLI